MSGFRDFNQPSNQLGKNKTLSSSLEEDDWDTEPDVAVQEEAIRLSATQKPRVSELNRAAIHGSQELRHNFTPISVPSIVARPSDTTAPVQPRTSVSAVQPPPQDSNASDWRNQQAPEWLPSKGGPGPKAVQPAPAPKPSLPAPSAMPRKLSATQLAAATNANPNLPTTISVSFNQPLPNTYSQPNPANYSNTAMGINAIQLSTKFPMFTPNEINAFHQQFQALDKDHSDFVHPTDLSSLATKAGESGQAVVAKMQAMSLVNDKGLVTFDGFLTAVAKVRAEKGTPTYTGVKDSTKIVLHGSAGENTTHTINVDEKESFTVHINQVLAGDKHLGTRIPIDPSTMQIFSECRDGLVLAKLINDAVPHTIDERVLNVNKKLNAFQITENLNVVVNSAKAIGCSVVNIGASDIMEGREHLILGLIWQIIKIGLQANIDIKVHPELFRLLNAGENLEDFLKLPVEQILLRWFNYHLKKAGWNRVVKNFNQDVKDGENYTILLNQLAPGQCSKAPLQVPDLLQRAEMILGNAEKIGCRKYLSAKTLVEGNAKLNFAFVANLFNTMPGLEKLTEAEMAGLDSSLFDSEGDREARAFALWLNSLGVEPFVNNLFDDLSDGLVLLQALDKVKPGLVDWKKVNRGPPPIASKFKKVENCNYVIVLGKALKFSLVGIQGSDLVDGIKKLTLAFVWQLMREHVIQTLKSLSSAGVEITDSDMINWANTAVKNSGKKTSMANFKDPSLRSSHFFLDLVNAIKPGIVNYDLVTPAATGTSVALMLEDQAKLNAQYAVSIARKLGATIFVLPEDIVEVKPKMILTLIGSLMALSKSMPSQ
ncbi:hypothetical protein HDV03_003233 [Kappamyces sp. JEL0829]|nr:hypothetical protein HDV03_003233 [Kappamyces sp. JEL0829]